MGKIETIKVGDDYKGMLGFSKQIKGFRIFKWGILHQNKTFQEYLCAGTDLGATLFYQKMSCKMMYLIFPRQFPISGDTLPGQDHISVLKP